MSVSTYTIISNPLRDYYPIEEMVLTNLQFADEVVIADFGSTDLTLELLDNLKSSLSVNNKNKLKIINGDTKFEDTEFFYAEAKNQALNATSKDIDWVIRIDADELIPELYYDTIKKLGKITNPKIDAFRFSRKHFYRDYNTIKIIPGDILGYTYMYRKSSGAEHIYLVGNCDGLVIEKDKNMHKNMQSQNDSNRYIFFDDTGIVVPVTVYHYGWCRPPRILLRKMQRIEKKLAPFNELRKKYYPGNYKLEQVNDWFKTDPDKISDEELNDKLFDMKDTTEFIGFHPKIMEHRISQKSW